MYRDSREKCPDVQKPNVQVSALCNYVLVTEVWSVLWVCGTAEALARDVNGGFSSLQGAGSAGDVCQAPCFFMCYKALLGRVGILEFSEQFLLVLLRPL